MRTELVDINSQSMEFISIGIYKIKVTFNRVFYLNACEHWTGYNE